MEQFDVIVVGAGPGDPELLTLKAVKAIAAATVLLVDDLVSDAVLAYAAPTARIVHVGKRGGCRSTPQAFIEKLMLQEAKAGENVVRLKGGDPFIFGRGGEELEHLQAHGVVVTVLNGITAGLAGVTSLGVSLTHREHAHGVVFITGHAKKDDANGVDWVGLARTAAQAKLTLVIYMGMSGAAQLQDALLQGLGEHTPVAVVQHVSLPTQRHKQRALFYHCSVSLLSGANTTDTVRVERRAVRPYSKVVGTVSAFDYSSRKHLTPSFHVH